MLSPMEAAKQLLAHPSVKNIIKPKTFKNVESFFNYKIFYYNLALTILASQTDETIRQKSISDNEFYMNYLCLRIGERFNHPLFFVKPELLEAADNTEITFDVEWDTVHLPFDSMTFILPRNYLITVGNVLLSYIHITKSNDTALLEHQCIFGDEKGVVISASDSSLQAVVAFGMLKTFLPSKQTYFVNGKQVDIPPTQKRIIHIVLNLIFAMAARPELVESGQRIGRHKKSNSEIWTPNIIGRKYTVKRPEGYEAGQTGTHKRLHWRRGHFRHQAHGKGLTERKIIWLEPVMVGVKTATE